MTALLAMATSFVVVIAASELNLQIWLSSCGVACGILSMLMFKHISPQEKLERVITDASVVQSEMKTYDGDLSGMLLLSRKNLALAGLRVWYSLIPSVVAGVPVIATTGWLNSRIQSPVASWLPPWMMIFIVAVSVSAICIKFAFRIK